MTTPLKKPKDGTNPDRADTVARQAVAGSIGAEQNTAMIQNRISEMETQLQALEQLRPLLSSLQDQAERLEGTQRRTDVRLDRAAESADNIQGQMEELSHSTDMALSLKKDITRFEHLIPQTKEHLGHLETLSTQVGDHVKAFQKRRDAISQAVDAAKDLDKVLQHIEVVATKQQEQAETSDQLEESLKSLQTEITDRSAEIRSRCKSSALVMRASSCVTPPSPSERVLSRSDRFSA